MRPPPFFMAPLLYAYEGAPSPASCAMPERRYLYTVHSIVVRSAAPLSSLRVSTCLLPALLISASAGDLRLGGGGTGGKGGSLDAPRWPVIFVSLPCLKSRRATRRPTMSSNHDENVAQQQPGGSDGYSPFKMGGSPYSPFKNGAPEPHRTSHQMSRSGAFRSCHVVACCPQATRRRRHRRLRRSPLRCGPPGFPRLAARPPAASVGRHEAAARV